jgi:hypothetical protein
MHLTTRCNRNEKQQDGKNNAELVDQTDEDGLNDLRRDY